MCKLIPRNQTREPYKRRVTWVACCYEGGGGRGGGTLLLLVNPVQWTLLMIWDRFSNITAEIKYKGRKQILYLTTYSSHFLNTYRMLDRTDINRWPLIYITHTHTQNKKKDITYHILCYNNTGGSERLEGRKEMFYLTMHSTHFIYIIW